MYLGGYDDRRGAVYYDDGNLGSFWTKIRDKVIKPVGRVVAAYYTGGASEVAFKAYDAQNAQKKMIEAQKKQQAQLAAMGNTYPPQAYPPSLDPAAMAAYQAGQPSPFPQSLNPYAPQMTPQAFAYVAPQAYDSGQRATIMPVQSQQQASQIPTWAIPAGVGALVLVALAARR